MVRLLVVAAVLTVATEAAAQLVPPPAEPPPSTPPSAPTQPIPPGYHVERKPNRALVIAGSVTFSAAYLGIVIPSLLIAARGTPSAGIVTIPIGGPLWYAQQDVTAVAIWTGLDALVQAAGAGMLIGGLVGKRVLVPGPAPRAALQLAPVPLRFGDKGAGVGLAGTF